MLVVLSKKRSIWFLEELERLSELKLSSVEEELEKVAPEENIRHLPPSSSTYLRMIDIDGDGLSS